ncbi:MAG: hypothetical protein V4459_03145 [Pseudomonadota bacterium]
MYLTEKTETAPAGTAPIVFEAIVRKQCIAATYNRQSLVLAPHVIFTKHDAIYVGAVTVSRDLMVPREVKMGVFKLDGLAGLRLTERAFETSALYSPHDERFSDNALMAVEG